MKTILLGALSIFTGTEIVSAQNINGAPIFNLLSLAQSVVSQMVPLLIGLAMLAFFYGLVMFIWKGKEGGEVLEKSKHFMIYSLLAMFVMVSIWGIIAVIQIIFGVQNVTKISYPTALPGQSVSQ